MASLLAQDTSVTSPLDGHAFAAVAGGVGPESLAGRTIGGYEFLSLIDEGGMGQVYRARDPHLPRDVAIKVILPTAAGDALRRSRFRREAETLAAFAHPHIAQIYAFVEAEGRSLLAMELVPGETLAERIGRGPVPVRDAMVIAEQIADALDAAHEQGIVHRDLKPANIRITPDGVVKVLDFGLATSRRPAAAESETMTHTVPGILVGTIAYMSPEQARGETIDKRTDVWAFGCVLFEMVTGRKPFAGSTTTDVLTMILEADPDWSRLPAALPERMRDLLRRCLDKDRKRRLRDIGEARVMLDDELRAAPTPGWMARDQNLSAPRTPVRRWAAQAAVLLLVALTGAAAAVYFRPAAPRQPRSVARLSIPLTGEAALSISGFARDMSLTPDGSSLVYVGNHATQLFVRRLDSVKPVPIANGQSMSFPFVSPDGQWVGYLDGNYVMKKVAITGGPSTALDGRGRDGATWLPDNTIVYASGSGTVGLLRVSALTGTDGGLGEVLTRPDRAKNEGYHRWPVALPGGQDVLFTIVAQSGGLDAARIAALDLRTRAQKIVLQGGSDGRYVANPASVAGEPSGFLVYLAQGLLRSIPFDLTRLETSGTAVAVNVPVMSFPGGAGNFDIDPDGALVVASSPAGVAEAPRSVVWVDRNGHESASGVPERPYLGVKISPDEKRLALTVLEKGERHLSIWDLKRHASTRLRFEPGIMFGHPLWTPTGDEIIFQAAVVGKGLGIWRMAASGIGSPERLTTSTNAQLATSLTSDHHVVFHEATTSSSLDILDLSLDGKRPITPLLHSKGWETNGVVSPDGHWLAYECCNEGSLEIHVRPYPNVQAGEWQVSNAGGRSPMWSQAGNELFFEESDGTMMSVAFDVSGSVWHPRTPARVFPAGFLWSEFAPAEATGYDLARDARRFLVIKAPASSAAAPPDVLLIQNWSEELPALFRPR